MKGSKKIFALILISIMTVSLLFGCSKNVQEADKENGNMDGSANKEEVTGSEEPIVARISGMSTDTLNAHISSSASEADVIELIYGNLLDLIYDEETENIKFVPWHAEDLPETEDNKTWIFKVRDDVKWSDGTPINAEDYEWSWKMLLDPELINRNASVFFNTIRVEKAEEYFKGEVEWEEVGLKAVDENTLEIKLEEETPEIDFLLAFTGGGSTSPVHKELYEGGMRDKTEEDEDVEAVKLTDYATDLDKTPSCGHYKLVEWVRDQHKVYEKNEDDQLTNIYVPDRIEERVISENATRIQLFEKGELDNVSVLGDDYDRYAEDPRMVNHIANTVWGFYINGESEENPVLQDNDLRKALFYGLNRESIAKGVFKVYDPAPYYISTICMVDWEKGLKYRDSEEAKAITPEGNGYDPDLAKEYFEKAYKANGSEKIEIELLYFDEQADMKRMAEVAEEEYENLFGKDKLDIVLRAMPPMAAYDAYKNRDFDMGIGAMSQSVFNAWRSMFVYTSKFPEKNETFYNDEFDKLYERTTTGDLVFKPKERIEALAEMEELLMDYVPMVPIFQNNNKVLYQEHIQLITGGEYVPGVGFAPMQAVRTH